MLKKIAKAFKPDLSQIANNLYAAAIAYFAPTVVVATLGWLSSFDPLDLVVTKGQIISLLLYSVMAIGFGTIVYVFISLIYRIFPPVVLRFSMALNKAIKKAPFSGRGMIFLNDVKKAPPFLGIKFSKPIIQPTHEKVLTEYFMALDFFSKYGSQIKGGDKYQIKSGETWEKISERVYGSKNFVSHILTANKGLVTPSTSVVIHLPRIDVSGTTGLTPELIEMKHSVLISNNVSKTLVELTNNFNLVLDEALQLFTLIWRTAVSSKASKW